MDDTLPGGLFDLANDEPDDWADEVDPADRKAGLAAWAAARSLADAGELMARWLEGATTYQPACFGARPEDETRHLVPALAALNRHGFVTANSQPGVPLDDGDGQRACVTGWCSAGTFEAIRDATLRTDLVVVAYEPGADADELWGAVVTIDGGEPFSQAGGPPTRFEDLFEAGPMPDFAEFHDAWSVTVIDPVWGRDDLLWDTLLAALLPATGRAADNRS